MKTPQERRRAVPLTRTLISAFEVPPDADEDFIAAWESATGDRATALHRALRADVDFRFVEVARWDSNGAARPSLYEIAREHATPDVEGGVVLINPFEVPDGEEERFLAGWDRAWELLARQRGYLGTRLHRSIGAADFRFVEIARWSSPLMFARALKRPDVQAAAQAIPFRSHPALYQQIRRRRG
jgi:heme oxygenase (mycobilin-producing)